MQSSRIPRVSLMIVDHFIYNIDSSRDTTFCFLWLIFLCQMHANSQAITLLQRRYLEWPSCGLSFPPLLSPPFPPFSLFYSLWGLRPLPFLFSRYAVVPPAVRWRGEHNARARVARASRSNWSARRGALPGSPATGESAGRPRPMLRSGHKKQERSKRGCRNLTLEFRLDTELFMAI